MPLDTLQNSEQMEDLAVNELEFEQFSPRLGITLVILSAVVFSICNVVVKRRGSPAMIAESDTWKWRNLYISWIHALIVGSWDILCFVFYPGMFNHLVLYQNRFMYGMVSFSTGYFLYDFIDLGMQGLLFSSWEITAHHLAVSSTFFYNLMQNKCVGYTAIALLSEVNTIFLHSRKLLQMRRVSFDSWYYRVITFLNIITFIFGRFVALIAIVIGMVYLNDQVSAYYFWTLVAAMVIMIPINIVLFWRLFKSDVLRPLAASKKSQQSSQNNHHSAYVSNHSHTTNNNKMPVTNGIHDKAKVQ